LFIGRERYGKKIQEHGLSVSNLDQKLIKLSQSDFIYATDPKRLAQSNDFDFILVTLKAVNTNECAEMLRDVNPKIPIISFQNGIHNADEIRQQFPEREVVAGMFPFNLVEIGTFLIQQASSGTLMVQKGRIGSMVARELSRAGILTVEHHDLKGILYGKLLINLNNAINALSGITVKKELLNHNFRYMLACSMEEALKVFTAAGITPRPLNVPCWLIPITLKTPTWFFKIAAAATVAVNEHSYSSMYDDLKNERTTEIDFLQGEVVSLGKNLNIPTPVNETIYQLVKTVEKEKKGSPNYSDQFLLEKLKLKPLTNYSILLVALAILLIPAWLLFWLFNKK